MRTKENDSVASIHQEKAKKLKKLRRWQIVVSMLGIVIIAWGIIQVVCLFLNYKSCETSNDAQIEQYISLSICVHRGILKRFVSPNIRRYIKGIHYWYLTTVNTKYG